MMKEFLLILMKKICWENSGEKNSDYEESSGKEILEKIQTEKNSDEIILMKKIVVKKNFFFYTHKK